MSEKDVLIIKIKRLIHRIEQYNDIPSPYVIAAEAELEIEYEKALEELRLMP